MVHTEAIISIFNSSDTNVIRIKKKKKKECEQYFKNSRECDDMIEKRFKEK